MFSVIDIFDMKLTLAHFIDMRSDYIFIHAVLGLMGLAKAQPFVCLSSRKERMSIPWPRDRQRCPDQDALQYRHNKQQLQLHPRRKTSLCAPKPLALHAVSKYSLESDQVVTYIPSWCRCCL